MSAALEVRGLSVSLGGVPILTDVTFEVGSGEVFAFIGTNGAGKTTTLRALATLLVPDRGEIAIAGVDVRRDPDRARRLLGYMPDHAGVYERTTVAEYLSFFAAAQGLPDSRVADVVALTGLGALTERDVSALSKGMKQRLQLARVLLHDPPVLLLDEPASDLDPRARVELRDLLLTLRARGKTIILSSHILSELADVSTQVGVLERGRMVAYGPIDAIGAALGDVRSNPVRPSHLGSAYRESASPASRSARMRVLGAAAAVGAILRSTAGIADVAVHGGEVDDAASAGTCSVTVRYADERALGRAVRALSAADLLVVAVVPESTELERIFLELTRGAA